jgi:hypothetical protein
VEVVDGVVFVSVPAAAPPSVVVSCCWTVSLLLMPDVPPPVSTVPLEPVVSAEAVVVAVVSVLGADGGVAAPVVGTVSVGAPVVSFDPELPPQAAMISATARAESVATDLRTRLLLVSCNNLPPGGSADRLGS